MAWTPNSFTTLASRTVTFSNANNNVTLTNHGFNNGAMIKFKTITTTTGISIDTFYYVINSQTNTFQVSSNGANTLTLSNDGTGTLYVLCSALSKLTAITFRRLKIELPFRKFSAINTIDNITILKQYITKTTLFFPFRFYSGLNAIKSSSLNLVSTGYSSIEQYAIPSNLNKLFFSGINTVSLNSFEYGIKFNVFRKLSSLKTLTLNSFEYGIKFNVFRKFSPINNLKTLTIKYSTAFVDRSVYTKYTVSALNNVKTLTMKYSTAFVSNTVGTKYTFVSLKLIRTSSTVTKLTNITNELFSKIKYSGLKTLNTGTTSIKLTDITNELFSKIKYSGINTVKNITMFYSSVFADNSVTTKFTFAGLKTIITSSTTNRLTDITNELFSKIKFSGINNIITGSTPKRLTDITNELFSKIKYSGINTVKNITVYYSNRIIDTKFTFAGLSSMIAGSTTKRLTNITNELFSKIKYSGINTVKNITVYYSNRIIDTKFTFASLNTMFVKTFSLKTWKEVMSDQVTKIIQFWS